MSTQNENTSSTGEVAKADPAAVTHTATLKHGANYFLRTKHFKNGVAVDVTDAEKEHLEEHAVDPVDVSVAGETTSEHRQKFVFAKLGEAPAAGKVRQRRAA